MPVQGNPSATAAKGTTGSFSSILQSYVYASGIHKPEVSNVLSYKFPQYYMTSLLDRLGSYEAIGQDTWTWWTQDRTRLGGVVASVANNTTATANFEVVAYVYGSPTGQIGYALVGDILRLESGILAKVTVVAQGTSDTNAQKLTVVRPDGTDFTSALLDDADTFGHIGTAFEEASSAPGTRLYIPDEEIGYLQIMRRSFEISGSEFTNKTWLGDGSAWYWTKEDLEMKEFARDKEGIVMFGEGTSNGTTKTTKGIFDYADADGVKNGFVGATGVSETDIQDHIKDMLIQGVSNEILVLCGAQFLADFQRAMRDYHVGGAISFGSFGANLVGLDVQRYSFMGKIINIVYYELFDDSAMVPAPLGNSVSSSIYTFTNLSLWIDMGSDSSGKKLISLKYKEHDGQSRKFIHAYEVGMMNPSGVNGGMVANGKDSFKIHYLCEVGVEVRLSNRLGLLRATS